MRSRFLMALLAFFAMTSEMRLFAQTTAPATQPALAPADPRPALAAFYDAVRKGDEPAAFNCWLDDLDNDQDRKDVEDIVHHLMAEMIASENLQAAIRVKFPADFEKRRLAGITTPDTAQLLACKYTIYRRLAICNWGNAEDDGFPMVLDNHEIIHNKPGVWKLSMQQWHETNRSSVGDSMLLSGWYPKAMDLTTKECLAGKFKEIDEVGDAFLNHLTQLADAETKKDAAATTQPQH